MPGHATFYFDLGSPYAYLAAERLDRSQIAVTWEPVLLGAMFGWRGHGSWAQTPERAARVAEIERRAASYRLPPVAWPAGWPSNTLVAMRACVWAAARGQAAPFALACFRRAFVEGHDVSDLAVLRAAATDVGLPAERLPAAVVDPEVKQELKRATGAAYEAGVSGVPTVLVDGRVLYGDDRLQEAFNRRGTRAARC